MPMFSRKKSSASVAASGAAQLHGDNTINEAASSKLDRTSSSSGNKNLGESVNSRAKLSRSASGISNFSRNSDTRASDLINRFTHRDDVPASRRVPSFTSISGQSVNLSSGAIDNSLSKANRPREPSTAASSVAASAHPSTSNLSATTFTSNLGDESINSTQASLRHRGDDAAISDSSSDDETYESPDEFLDFEVESPRVATPSAPSTAAATASFSPSDAARLAVISSSDTSLQADLRQIWYAISLFLNSQFAEAEAICATHKDDRLYYALGSATLGSIKALMSFEPDQLAWAVDLCKNCLSVADRERNNWAHTGGRGWSWSEKITGGIGSVTRGSSLTIDIVRRMSVSQRHAELAYAECLLLKAVVSLMYAGDFVAFIKESLNMRSAHAIYKVLRRYIMEADAANSSGHDPSIDLDFRSGVDFGIGCSSLILSLLPPTAVKIVELFGFSGNREEALGLLMKTSGWSKGTTTTSLGEGPGAEGLRRPVCDLVLLLYHVIISSILPIQDVDMALAERIIEYNLARYPDGVFFLYFSGRLYSTETLASKALEQYQKALAIQQEAGNNFKQIQYIFRWDMSLTYFSLGDYVRAKENISILAKESKWSKAVYAYGDAVATFEVLQQESAQASESPDAQITRMQIRETMKMIPGYVQRIAGKSLPFEKYVARKSKKFLAQDDSLALPGLELSYMLACLSLAPRHAILTVHLPEVERTLSKLQLARDQSSDGAPKGWWDDFCLANFMRGVLLHYLYRPDPQVKPEPFQATMSLEEADKVIIESLRVAVDNSVKLELDHHVAYLAHFELARLLIKLGPAYYKETRDHLNLVLEGKVPFGPSKGKGKVSMQNGVVLKANGTLEQLNALEKT